MKYSSLTYKRAFETKEPIIILKAATTCTKKEKKTVGFDTEFSKKHQTLKSREEKPNS